MIVDDDDFCGAIAQCRRTAQLADELSGVALVAIVDNEEEA
jgi:hypothetical protein